MDIFRDLPLSELTALYNQKNKATKMGDLNKLIQMKTQYPELFNTEKEKEKEYIILMLTLDYLQSTDWYKDAVKKELRSKLTLIKNTD